MTCFVFPEGGIPKNKLGIFNGIFYEGGGVSSSIKVFLDALASLEFKLSVSQSVSDLPFVIYLKDQNN